MRTAALSSVSTAEQPEVPEGFHHWPTFTRVIGYELNDRQLLGMPGHYVPGRLDTGTFAEDLSPHLDTRLLGQMVEDARCSLEQRVSAGSLLALAGDPRIRPLDPPMVEVAGGEVAIGLDAQAVDQVLAQFAGLGIDRAWIEKEVPRHRVRLRPYRIGRYPVTHFEYRLFLSETCFPELPDSWPLGRYPRELSNHPVHTVSPCAARAYCVWLSRRTGRHFRLPSEAQWEHGASGGAACAFPWGDEFLPDRANTAESGILHTTPVGAFPRGAAPCGALDMAGNVEEYVLDRYAPYPDGRFVRDHLVELEGEYVVARGGSFARFRDLARVTRRHGYNPRSRVYAMGFRLAEELS